MHIQNLHSSPDTVFDGLALCQGKMAAHGDSSELQMPQTRLEELTVLLHSPCWISCKVAGKGRKEMLWERKGEGEGRERNFEELDTYVIWWTTFTCTQKLMNSQLNLPHGTKQKVMTTITTTTTTTVLRPKKRVMKKLKTKNPRDAQKNRSSNSCKEPEIIASFRMKKNLSKV